MVRRAVSLLTATILVMAAAIGLAASPAGAAVGPGEDRQLASPAGWWTYTGVTAAQVTSYLNANGARLTDIKSTGSGSSQRFTVTMVQNSGAYGTGWLWYYNITPAQVVSLANDNTARPTVVQCYDTASGVRCAAIMIGNTGANAEGWSFYYGTASFIDSKVTSTNRLVSYGRIQGTALYSAVFGSNTGTDATSWWYYRGVSSAALSSAITRNRARLVDLDRNNDTGTYNAVMYANPGIRWYWYTGYSSVGSLVAKASQLGARLFDVSPYPSGGRTTWSGLMVENLTSASRAVFDVLAPTIDSGTWGYSLQPLDGGSAAALQTGTVFEPASVLKTVYHYLSINRQESGLPNSTSVTYRLDPSDPTNKDICPDNFNTTATTTLVDADTRMMQNSDNRTTRGIRELYGTSAVDAQIAALGMTDTEFHHNIGCPTATTHNETTLADLARLYGAYDDATDITTMTWRNQFKVRMLNEDDYAPYLDAMCPLVKQRAAALGKPVATANAFCARISWLAKGGSYQYSGGLPAVISYATSSMTELPFKTTGGAFAPRAYFWGDFVDGMTLNSSAEGTTLANARSHAYRTAITPFLDAALSTW